jgi:hypothetical protein
MVLPLAFSVSAIAEPFLPPQPATGICVILTTCQIYDWPAWLYISLKRSHILFFPGFHAALHGFISLLSLVRLLTLISASSRAIFYFSQAFIMPVSCSLAWLHQPAKPCMVTTGFITDEQPISFP